MAALALTSCSNDEEDAVQTLSPIGFRAVTANSKMGRLTLMDGAELKKHSFEVYAFTSKEHKPFMGHPLGDNSPAGFSTGVKMKFENGNWTYAKPAEQAFWPIEALNFYAFYPESVPSIGYTVEVASDQKQKVTYAVPTAIDKQVDILYAMAKEVTHKTSSGKVNLHFKHALSLVEFKAKTQLESMKVEIKDMKLHVYSHMGTMTLPEKEGAAPTWEVLPKTPTLNGNNLSFQQPVENIGNGEAVNLFQRLYLPQDLKAWDTQKHTIEQVNIMAGEDAHTPEADKESYLSILCKIKQNGVYLWGSDEEYTRLFVPFGATWEPGKHYVYTLVFGGGYNETGKPVIAPIQIETQVDAMDEESKTFDIDKGLPTQKS